jgi:hypothetical protein
MEGRMTPPDLSDPGERAAYRHELREVAKPFRYIGVGFALSGAALAVVRARWLPTMPTLVPLAAIAIGLFHMVAAIAIRTRYHMLRMRSD